MKKLSHKYMLILPRLLLSIFFIVLSVDKILNFGDAVTKIESVGIATTIAVLAVSLSVAIGLLASLFLIFGFYTKTSAWMLIIFTIIGTISFHINFNNEAEILTVLRNLAIIGGLLHIILHSET